MEVVIAGDIIDSQINNPSDYLEILDPILKKYAKEGMYHIYRGDSFQAWIKTPEQGLLACIEIKAALKRTGFLDVRIAIGLGAINLIDNDIARSTGSALTRSGQLLDSLKEKEQNIMIASTQALDVYINTALKMGLLFMNSWTKNSAAIIYEAIKNPKSTQTELGNNLGIKQATASRRLERAYWSETQELIALFKQYYKDVNHAPTH